MVKTFEQSKNNFVIDQLISRKEPVEQAPQKKNSSRSSEREKDFEFNPRIKPSQIPVPPKKDSKQIEKESQRFLVKDLIGKNEEEKAVPLLEEVKIDSLVAELAVSPEFLEALEAGNGIDRIAVAENAIGDGVTGSQREDIRGGNVQEDDTNPIG